MLHERKPPQKPIQKKAPIKYKTNLSKEQNQTLKDLFDFLSELSIDLKNRDMFFSGLICEVFMSRIYNQFLSKVDGSS